MGYAKESALTPKADVRGPMSAFPPISSALHLGADVLVTCPRLPVMTLSGPDTTLFHRTLHSTFATRSVVISSRAMDP